MILWADADSLPRDVREILVRRARTLSVRFVASKALPDIPFSLLTLVPPAPDAADSYIEHTACAGDLVVTRDIPHAERLAERGILVLNDRGDTYTVDTVRERRSLRDRMAELRLLGLAPESPRGSSRGLREKKRFADALDRAIASLK